LSLIDFHKQVRASAKRHLPAFKYMKKKAAAKVKQSSAKPKKNKVVASTKTSKLATPPPAPKRISVMDDPRFAQAVQNYEAGVKAFQSHKFDRAKALLEKVVSGPSKELADRASVHLNVCNQQLARSSSSAFKSHEEHYDYAISLMNSGDYDGAREHLEKLQKQVPKADYVWYGLAVLDCLTRRFEVALKNLEEAINRDNANRYRARNEADFKNLADDPRFTELLYPEGPEPRTTEPVTQGQNGRRR